ISKASARQRAGRAGRTKPGTCFRLYTKHAFDNVLLCSTPPGILTQELTKEVLLLKAIGHDKVGRFDFVDPPHTEVYLRAMQQLMAMGHLDGQGRVTKVGKDAAKMPIHPAWYNVMLKAKDLDCLPEILSIADLASTQNSIFARPHRIRYAADEYHVTFATPVSDHLSALNAFHTYWYKLESGQDVDQWCFEFCLSKRVLEEVVSIRRQLFAGCKNRWREFTSLRFDDPQYNVKIRKAILHGFFYHTAFFHHEPVYKIVQDNHPVGIDPTSSLVKMGWDWVIYQNMHYTSKQHMITVTAVEVDWLLDYKYFHEDNLARKYNGDFKNPPLAEALQKARAKRVAANPNWRHPK
ncbi:hypothetical protein FDECE_9764, partial [Fusarium decemcellulare]